MINLKVDIVILNRNGNAHAIAGMQALFQSTVKNFHVYFIDDHSQDDSLDQVRQWVYSSEKSDQVTFLTLSRHSGCCVGYNVAFERLLTAPDPYVLILNNDVLVSPELIGNLILRMERNKDWGMLSPKLRSYPDSHRVWFSKGYIIPWLGFVMRSRRDRKGIVASQVIPTCCVLVRKSGLRQIAKIDERYFIGYWDMELGYQFRRLGYLLMVDNDLHAMHYGSKTIGPLFDGTKQYYYNRNRLLFFCKNIHARCQYLFLFLQFLLVIPLCLMGAVLLGKAESIPYALAGYKDFLSNKFGPNPRDRNEEI